MTAPPSSWRYAPGCSASPTGCWAACGTLSIFKINGLGYADATQLIAVAGFLAMFFFLTLYMQTVLGYSPIQTGLAYLPLCVVIGACAGISSQLLTRVGTRPMMVGGALISAGGRYWLSRIPVHGSFLTDLLAHHLLAEHATVAHAETSAFQRALFTGSVFILASAVIALRATNTRGPTEERQPGSAAGVADPETVIVTASRGHRPARRAAEG